MRTISLAKSGMNKIRSYQKELKSGDVEDSIKSFTPGEWCWLKSSGSPELWLAFVNPLVEEKFSSIFLIHQVPQTHAGGFEVEGLVSEKIRSAYLRRTQFAGYADGCRAFYGANDGLPGLIIDKYKNAAIIQINIAGVDRFRELVKKVCSEALGVPGYFLDNAKYREKEGLPVFSQDPLPDLTVSENGLTYQLRSEVIQKVGFYYDHRENRVQMRTLIERMANKPARGLDLFSYAGAWGMNALKAGTSNVDFVDQGEFSREIQEGLERNGFSGRGKFFRSDVFKFLDEASSQNQKYDLILCDPPAFAKNLQQKTQALEGYSKLHRKVMKLTRPGSLCVFSSCTHYVGQEEFQKNILEAAYRENKKIQLLHCGVQGWDHPVNSFEDRACYIKSYTYLMES